MIRVMEAVKAAVPVAADQEVILEFVDADMKAQTTSLGSYQPITGVLKASGTGVISNITKMVCRKKDAPDHEPKLIFKLTTGLTLAEFNDIFAHNATLLMALPKLTTLGGYEVVLTLDLGTAVSTISWVTKGENQAVHGGLNAAAYSPAAGISPATQAANTGITHSGQQAVAAFRQDQRPQSNVGGLGPFVNPAGVNVWAPGFA